MKTTVLGSSSLRVTRLCYGCWRIAGWSPEEVTPTVAANARRAILAAYEAGYTFFDHADIYCHGVAEEIFGKVLKETAGMRERVVIATKCGIRRADDPTPGLPARWDFSRDYIISATEASLRRLGVETIDLLMLHRPDYLADPSEIAAAFSELKRAGKVRWFGVSNFRPSLVSAVAAACPMPLAVHQVEISLAKLDAFSDGTFDQCLASKLGVMAWSPLAGGLLADGAHRLLSAQKAYRTDAIRAELDAVAAELGTSRSVVAFSWLMKHPSGIIPVVGSTDPARIRQAVQADELDLTREQWYRLFTAATGSPLP